MKRKKPSATTHAIGYVRVSTDKQELSPEAQEERIRSYCAHRGLRLIDVIIEKEVSGGTPLHKRDGGAEVLEAVEYGEVQHVVTVRLDRLFRNVLDCVTVVPQWDRDGIALHLVDLGGSAVDTSSAMGRFMITLMAAMAEMERVQISERTKAVLKLKRDRGEAIGPPRYGYRRAEDGIHEEQCPDEQRVLTLIYTLRQQRMSYRGICEYLNTTGVAARGERWHPYTLARFNKYGLLPEKPPRKRRRKARLSDGCVDSGPGREAQREAREMLPLGTQRGESNQRKSWDVEEAA